jgi:hypothetical protein
MAGLSEVEASAASAEQEPKLPPHQSQAEDERGRNRPRRRSNAQPPSHIPLTRTARLASRHLAAARLSDHITCAIARLVRRGNSRGFWAMFTQRFCLKFSRLAVSQYWRDRASLSARTRGHIPNRICLVQRDSGAIAVQADRRRPDTWERDMRASATSLVTALSLRYRNGATALKCGRDLIHKGLRTTVR